MNASLWLLMFLSIITGLSYIMVKLAFDKHGVYPQRPVVDPMALLKGPLILQMIDTWG